MAVALGQTYAMVQSSDLYVVAALGGGTAPTLVNVRNGRTLVVDEAALTGASGPFFLIGGSASSPKFAPGAKARVINEGTTPAANVVSYNVFLVVGAFTSTVLGVNYYTGYLLPPDSPVSSSIEEGAYFSGLSAIPEYKLL